MRRERQLHALRGRFCFPCLLLVITLPLLTVPSNAAAGGVILCAAVPGLAAAFPILVLKTHDTKGVDLSAVRGDEWD